MFTDDSDDIGLNMRPTNLETVSMLSYITDDSPTASGNVMNGKSTTVVRNQSYGNLGPEKNEAKVLVIYTGGTIGMIRNEKNVLTPLPNELVKRLRRYPHMHDEEYAHRRFGNACKMAPLVLPLVQGEKRRIVYTISEYDPLLDSSNMSINDWVQIAEDIQQSYEFFDGFVVLHGTDTLSYTASALSFMLENLGKTVIITGSQIPIFETRTDGKDNLMSALILAGNYVIPEVCVFFNSKLFRGNRTIKISSENLDAFNTPNVPCLARIGINVEIDYRLIFRPCGVEKFKVHPHLDEFVGLLRIFPSISTPTVCAFLQPPMRGVVLQSFGSGNIPTNREDLKKALKDAADRGVILVNCTQCTTGSVSEIYETGCLKDCGVIPGFDMTPEAALTKLSYVLSKNNWSLETKKMMIQSSLRGELTSGRIEMKDFDLVDAVARSLHISTPKELSQLGQTLFPAMLNTAVVNADISKMESLKGYGADLSGINYDQRTALHLAASEGNLEVVKFLLLHGAAVHIRDRYDRTPLMEAIINDRHDIIKMLGKCGSHLTGSARGIGENLCGAATRGLIKRLDSYRLAGADLAQPDPSGRTALHMASLHKNLQVVQYLLKHNGYNNEVDMLGLRPIDYAEKGGDLEIVKLLEAKETNGKHID